MVRKVAQRFIISGSTGPLPGDHRAERFGLPEWGTDSRILGMRNNAILAIASDKNGDLVKPPIRISDYEMTVAKGEDGRKDISEMVYHRFHGRYIKPFLYDEMRFQDHYNNGFSIMASCCLLIEALESFRNGWEKTQDRGKEVFDSFFQREAKREPGFKGFRGQTFYPHVRCGILHQGETTGGFILSKTGAVFDSGSRKINARKFLTLMETSLAAYTNELLTAKWDSEIWDNFRRKMRFIIGNCEP